MPQKPTRRKRSEPRLPKSKPIDDTLLDEWKNTLVKIFTVSGGCLTGRLVRYDEKSLVISPKTCVQREHIVSMYDAKNAPDKAPAGPAVR